MDFIKKHKKTSIAVIIVSIFFMLGFMFGAFQIARESRIKYLPHKQNTSIYVAKSMVLKEQDIVLKDFVRNRPVEFIASSAFNSNQYIETIECGTNLHIIYDHAFYNATNLKKAVLKFDGVVILMLNSFYGNSPDFKIYVPQSAYESYVRYCENSLGGYNPEMLSIIEPF